MCAHTLLGTRLVLRSSSSVKTVVVNMVAQPVTGCDTDSSLCTMDASRAAGSGKRMRCPDEQPPMAAAAGPRPAAATLEELTDRVIRLEQGRKTDMQWWKECANYVNDHGAQLDDLQSEALQYNDNLHLVATDCREHTNALGRDTVQSLKVVEEGIMKVVNVYNGNFEQWRTDSKNLLDVIDLKVRDIEQNLNALKQAMPTGPTYKAPEEFHIGTPQATRSPGIAGMYSDFLRGAQGPLPGPGAGQGGLGARDPGEAAGVGGEARIPLLQRYPEQAGVSGAGDLRGPAGHGGAATGAAAGGELRSPPSFPTPGYGSAAAATAHGTAGGGDLKSPPGFPAPGSGAAAAAPGQASAPAFGPNAVGQDGSSRYHHPDNFHGFQYGPDPNAAAYGAYGIPVGPPPTGYYGTGYHGGQDRWGQPKPVYPRLNFDSKVLDIKYALDAKHQYDGGEKTGESWRVNTRDFLVGRMFPIKKLLEWAEQHDINEVKDEKIEELRPYMGEDPMVISHLL